MIEVKEEVGIAIMSCVWIIIAYGICFAVDAIAIEPLLGHPVAEAELWVRTTWLIVMTPLSLFISFMVTVPLSTWLAHFLPIRVVH